MPNEIIICVALCMFMDGKLVEHTYQSSMSECLKNKRIAERTIQPERVQFACGNDIEAEVEYVEEKGSISDERKNTFDNDIILFLLI